MIKFRLYIFVGKDFTEMILCPPQGRRQWHPTPVLLPGKSHGRRRLVGCSPWVATSRTWLSDFTFTFHFHALEKEMATRSSVLAWGIPGTAGPGGLPSMGSHRVEHNWSDLAAAAREWSQSIYQLRRLTVDHLISVCQVSLSQCHYFSLCI